MNRRSFLKTLTGFTLGVSAGGLVLPTEVKSELVKPIAKLISENYLDDEIRSRIVEIKKDNQNLQFGELHCHSYYSDGSYSVKDLMLRAASLGLDFLVITEHLTPRNYKLESCLDSIIVQRNIFNRWDHGDTKPPAVYPAFEISTKEGHLIALFPEDYFKPERLREIKHHFSRFDYDSISVELTARLIREMGAVSIVTHPNIKRSYPFGISSGFVKEHLVGLVDGIEDMSAGHGYQKDYSTETGLATIGSSDDHFNIILGTVVTSFDGARHGNIIEAIRSCDTRAVRLTNSIDILYTPTKLFFNI
jgi:predicted metal-dependent phosphoesterase TrpH